MPRLGELLVAAGLLTSEQVEQGLRAQVAWGGRLGTNLVELHFLDLDALSQALGRQHKMPAALAKHFERADPALQRLLTPDFAERFSCVPLLRIGPEQQIVIASISPLSPKQLAIVADELAVDVPRLVPAIAAELRIRYQLERVYNIRRAARFLRAHGTSVPPFPAFPELPQSDPELELTPLPVTGELAIEPGPPSPAAEPGPTTGELAVEPGPPPTTQQLDTFMQPLSQAPDDGDDELLPVEVVAPDAPESLDEIAVTDGTPLDPIEDEATRRERRRYVPTIADAPPGHTDRIALVGRIAIRKVAVGSSPRIMAGATLGEATRAVRRSTDRDRVAELAIDTLDRFAPGCAAAILLVIRGATAVGWKGFVRGGGALGEIAVPIEDRGLVARAVATNASATGAAGALSPIDELLLGAFGMSTAELAVVPIAIASRVMCVIAMAISDPAAVATAESVAAAAGAAFARLMRDAGR